MHGLHNGLLFGDGAGERLLAVYIFAIFCGFGSCQRVPMVGNGDHDSINIFARHHFSVIVVTLAVLVPIMPQPTTPMVMRSLAAIRLPDVAAEEVKIAGPARAMPVVARKRRRFMRGL